MTKPPTLRAKPFDVAIQSPEQFLEAIEVLQQRIGDLERTLERQERLATLGTIAGLIAHEFNNILTPVMSYAQMALAAPEDAALAQKALQKAADGADRAGQIAGAILGLVRRDQPTANAQNAGQRCEVRSAIDRALACLARPLDKDMIDLRNDVAADAAVAARGVAIEHVFLNLIINARSAMLPRGGVLSLRSTTNLPNFVADSVVSWSGGSEREWPPFVAKRRNMVIEVTDSGRGMSGERMSRLFALTESRTPASATPSGQVDTPFIGDRRGNGLGMLVCKRLVEDAGGVLLVSSEAGRGTSVFVVLPAAAEQ